MNNLSKAVMDAIAEAISKGIAEREDSNNEVWLSPDELKKQFGMITDEWYKRYAWKLPRQRFRYAGDDGKYHYTRWGYARNQIQRMIREGKIDDL